VGILFNEDTSHFIQTRKCIRHGDPLYPMLFKNVADMIASLIAREKEDGK
jgi:hypothetical protein